MSKKKREGSADGGLPRETGGLADTNCGIILSDIVSIRSWTVVIIAILLASIFLRTAVGLGGYSGINPLESRTTWMELYLLQDMVCRRCLAILRHRDIGWS
jgi:hypothetical protein